MTKYLPSMLEVPDSVPTSGGRGQYFTLEEKSVCSIEQILPKSLSTMWLS